MRSWARSPGSTGCCWPPASAGTGSSTPRSSARSSPSSPRGHRRRSTSHRSGSSGSLLEVPPAAPTARPTSSERRRDTGLVTTTEGRPATRSETDSMGAIDVPADHYWGAQTQRSLHFFDVGRDTMPPSIIWAFGILKKAAAEVNNELGLLPDDRRELIQRVADEVIAGSLAAELDRK